MLGCGPLGRAILEENVEKVQMMLQRFPSLIQEQNLLGQTPFHLAAFHPDILDILFNKVDDRLLDVVDHGRHWHGGGHAADYAIGLSGATCSNGRVWEACSGCPCVEPFNSFLAHGFLFSFRSFLVYHFTSASHACRLAVIRSTKAASERLKNFARLVLPSADLKLCQLDTPHVLDYWAARVVDSLETRGIALPAGLKTELEMLDILSCVSVYHWLADWNRHDPYHETHLVAEFLLQQGFLDVDLADSHGHTPLSTLILYPSWSESDPSYGLWLIRHGADISRPWPLPYPPDINDRTQYNTNLTIAHMILQWHFESVEYLESEGLQLVSLVAQIDVYDECRCGCLDKGCHTLQGLFKTLWKTRESQELRREAISAREMAAMLFNDCQGLRLQRWEHMCISALRLFTFEMLELRHTCCDMPYVLRYSPEEIAEIQDEDRATLDFLEELMEELTEAYRRRGFEFADFLVSYWAPRVDEVLTGLDAVRLTEAERHGAEHLGVRWSSNTVCRKGK